ncbi:MAG TPA: M48 family metallopeptidase [Methylomirabilota bacterium]|nr:M48 family metallopeptidase [Methylomirabilota bacterium]
MISRRGGWGLALLLALLVMGSATARAGGKKGAVVIGETEERDIGAKMAAQIRAKKRFVADKTIVDYVNRTGQNIARLSDRPDIPYHFAVIEDKTPAAFAAPGGYIYVHTGLLKTLDSQSQLAGVLAHEIGHIAARHGVKQLQEGLGSDALSSLVLGGVSKESTLVVVNAGIAAVLAGYSRDMESEADSYGTMYMARAGFNPEGMAQAMDKVAQSSDGGEGFWENLSKKRTPAAKRAAAVRGEIKDKGLDAGLPSDPQPYRVVKARVP